MFQLDKIFKISKITNIPQHFYLKYIVNFEFGKEKIKNYKKVKILLNFHVRKKIT